MANVLVNYAHPGHRYSVANKALLAAARQLEKVTVVDLYAAYPRHDIEIQTEQQRLLAHDVIVFQFPLLWYSTPSLVKEWLDLVLEHGFAYGSGGDSLAGKTLLLAVTAAGPEPAYQLTGDQRFALRTFLTPLEQTARLCGMHYLPPYALFGSLRAHDEDRLQDHVEGYQRLLGALRDETIDQLAATELDLLNSGNIPLAAPGDSQRGVSE